MYPFGLQLQMLLLKGIMNCRYSVFDAVNKEQQIDNKRKINYNLPENTFETVKPYFGLQNILDCTVFEH